MAPIDIEAFFRRYANASTSDTPEDLARFYDESFLAAAPAGAAAFKNDDGFLEWLRQVHAFNQQTGLTAIEVEGVSNRPLGDHYVMADVEWSATYRAAPAPIRFTISYLLRLTEGGPMVVAYVSHDDQDAVMREHGLL